MKKYLSCLVIASLPISLLAQKPVKIYGVVKEGKVDSFGIVNITQDNITQPKMHYVKPDAQGKFEVSIPTQTQFNNIIVVNGNQHTSFLAVSKDKLQLELGMAGTPTVNFVNASANSPSLLYQQFEQKHGGFQQVLNETRTVVQLEPEKVIPTLDSLKKVQYSKLAVTPNAAYNKFIQEQLDIYNQNALLMYAAFKMQSGGNMTEADVVKFIATSKQATSIVNDKYIFYPIYQDYIVNYSLYQYIYENIDKSGDASANISNAVKKMYALPEKKSTPLAVGKLLTMAQKGMDPAVWTFLGKEFYAKYPKDPSAIQINNSIEELQKFDPGKKAIDFEFVTLEGERKKLSDYKGKVVYLDFWASWCGPCRQQMPFAKEVKKHFQGQDVVFLYVSIDDTDEKWKKGIEAMQVEGVQTRSGGWSGDLPKIYNVSSIPAYFLIDKQGNFAARPPRPSQKQELIQVIETLLKQ